nr:FprA family A-type flavoprotein [candidate division Zixibacteria bacterium]
MLPTEIKKDIHWVGVVDWDLRDFHGYSTEKGSTYNAYLVKGTSKTVLFDTVNAKFTGEFIENLREVIEPGKIDYIVCNHAEMDHTGSLAEIIDLVHPEKIICNKICQDALLAHYNRSDWPFEIIKEGDGLDLGGRTVQFFGSPMIHWPESMVSYIPEERLLISNDIFGQHWATSERFDDQVNQGELFWQSAKYYANIFMPTSPSVAKFLAKLETNKLEPDMIAPDHGLIWRRGIPEIMKAYHSWSDGQTIPKALVVYDTMWGSTARMARAIGRGLSGNGISVRLFDLHYNHRSDIATEMLDARAIIIGSPIINNHILPKMADLLSYLQGLKPMNKIGASFGSYGWKNMITKMLNEQLEKMKVTLVDEGVSSKYVPSQEILGQCFELGRKVRMVVLEG